MDVCNNICNHCNKTFTSKYILKTHLERNKKCMNARGLEITSQFVCKSCNHISMKRSDFQIHLSNCMKYALDLEKETCEKKIEEKDIYITKIEQDHHDKLQEKNEYIAKLETKIEKMEAKLEAKLEKLQSTVTTIALESNRNKEDETDDDDDNIPVPLGEQMSSIVIEEVKEDILYSNIILNNVVITSRPLDHYVNATQLCQAGGKKFNDWFRLDTTKELIVELSSDAGIPVSLLVETVRGQSSKFTQGSWIHPDLSIQLAQWISPKFAIQVSKWMRELFNQGSLQIDINLLREKSKEMRIKDHRIKQLEAVCLSKQRRVEYPERNVIYMLTTDDHLKRRTYIIGKAKNLTNRLSTYNKTCDHTVIYYRECKNDDDMDAAETMVLTKLRSHREQANRDRFILPEDKDETFFTQTIDECVLFLA